mmetsp:Transcript_25920/g.50804  ORF Transcript_25920/g.50804 Transcript_25920/m.50804 type:complete len:120 (-) Transcript_25920:494-853(-)
MVAPAISRRFEGSTFVEEKKVLQLDWAVLVCSRFRFRWSTEGTSVVGILGVTEVVETKQKGGGRVAGFSCAGGGIKGDRSFDETDRSVGQSAWEKKCICRGRAAAWLDNAGGPLDGQTD